MSFEPIVNIDSIKDNIAYQYSESTNLIDYIGVLLTPFDELEVVYADILNKRDFDNATTDVLDTWGVIVDQPRESYDNNVAPFFGLDADDVNNPVFHKGLGDLNDNTIGGLFRSIEQPIATIVKLGNEDYKDILIGKQHANNFDGGVEALISAITDVLEITTTGAFEIEEVFTTPTDPFVRITFYVTLTDLQKNYLEVMDILPKPGGIRYEFVYT